MTERHQSPVEYWTADEELGEVTLWRGEAYALRLKARLVEEHYRQSTREEIVPLTYQSGERTYIHARPYVLIPDIQIDVQHFPTPVASDPIGIVASSERTGMQHRELGECQAWYYHGDRVLILWEAYFHDDFRGQNPVNDPNLAVLWDGFERFLARRFPAARLIATTHGDPLYETSDYQKFLQTRGYRRLNPVAFGKPIDQWGSQHRR